jgi:hypothetical protein
MIPVTQTKVVVRNSQNEIVQNGNCWAAAIASILELPITEVPNFEVWFKWEDGFWYAITERFLHLKGYTLENGECFKVFHMSADEWGKSVLKQKHGDYHEVAETNLDKFYFVSGQSARGVSHVTIYQNGVMVHDPHPTREGIIEQSIFEHIRPLTDQEKTNVADYRNNYDVGFPSREAKR